MSQTEKLFCLELDLSCSSCVYVFFSPASTVSLSIQKHGCFRVDWRLSGEGNGCMDESVGHQRDVIFTKSSHQNITARHLQCTFTSSSGISGSLWTLPRLPNIKTRQFGVEPKLQDSINDRKVLTKEKNPSASSRFFPSLFTERVPMFIYDDLNPCTTVVQTPDFSDRSGLVRKLSEGWRM